MTKEPSFTVRDMPREERPRERLQALGAGALSAQELLAIVIGRGVAGKPVTAIAQELIWRFGSISGVSEATIEELSRIKGLGSAKAIQLKACFELAKRMELTSDVEDFTITSPQSVVKAVRARIKDKAKEHFMLIILNTRNKVTSINNVSVGTLNASLVHPREVFRDAIRQSASSVVLAHNHPSGNETPSEEDLKITKRLVEAGKIIGIEVLDHIIIGKDGFCSFKEKGLL